MIVSSPMRWIRLRVRIIGSRRRPLHTLALLAIVSELVRRIAPRPDSPRAAVRPGPHLRNCP
ncbi:MAG: hypothetical protein AUI11_01210 [Acidobacteria bacterium 13_2_20CM_2_66_4]|nr:MAG: hypothetical protein AUI11_01210 [Acidobacteria bacterium 13_2_20CM_2_66_4]